MLIVCHLYPIRLIIYYWWLLLIIRLTKISRCPGKSKIGQNKHSQSHGLPKITTSFEMIHAFDQDTPKWRFAEESSAVETLDWLTAPDCANRSTGFDVSGFVSVFISPTPNWSPIWSLSLEKHSSRRMINDTERAPEGRFDQAQEKHSVGKHR